MTALTAKQSAALERVVRDAVEHFGVDMRVEDFNIHYEEEVRPGRGHQIRADYINADHAVSVYMDVYGYPSWSVANVDFLHNSGDEECDCTLCDGEATA
ncbi:hypothetical protein [Arthrobacter sp. ok362]|uniref:hypothetical protein n=1 Tax=Arthrobacter sp. ok362 TaxID=1761745 RepID=UPI000883163B|nr:hypothetical protein [Arthrobacter sp. ok362]SDK80315.1 hypothetical protein SAMN04487913_103230 [Arthrobacter sp. ok362]